MERQAAMASRGSSRGGAPSARSSGARQLAPLLIGFGFVVALFMASTVYADSRLALVARLSHRVSEGALPGSIALGQMRYEMMFIDSALEKGCRGHRESLQALPEHLRAYEQAYSTYSELRLLSGVSAVWRVAQEKLEHVEQDEALIEPEVRAGMLDAAQADIDARLDPDEREVDNALEALIQFNEDEGKRAARAASRAWARARRLSLIANAACAVLTATLAWLAFRSTRQFMIAQKRRADELDAFASRVAHDVRGPLAPVSMALQTLQRDFPDDARRRSLIERGMRSLGSVNRLVDDLLTFARASAKPSADARAPLDAVVAGAVQDLETAAAAARVRVIVEGLPPCDLACSPGVLSSIVMNLVSNAIKHMPPEAAERVVRIRAEVRQAKACVEVADTGAGLPESLRERVFEPYVRLDERRPGLGLGLATVRRLVQAHGGRVGVRSRDGAGAVFWFEMPVRAAAATSGR
jgi:signal transduction histidine kinase